MEEKGILLLKWLLYILNCYKEVKAQIFPWVGSYSFYCHYGAGKSSETQDQSGRKKLKCATKLSFSSLLTRNEGTTDDSGKRFGCYQQNHCNLHRLKEEDVVIDVDSKDIMPETQSVRQDLFAICMKCKNAGHFAKVCKTKEEIPGDPRKGNVRQVIKDDVYPPN